MSTHSVVLIGAGNMAHHLAKGFYASGVDVLQIINRSKDKAQKLAQQVHATASDDLGDIRTDADIYLVAVKDDAIRKVAAQLNLPKGIIAHTSGTVSIEALHGSAHEIGVFYPLQTFKASQKVDWQQVPIFVEGSSQQTLEQLNVLGSCLSKQVKEIDSEQRAILHIAAVFLNNFTNHILAGAEELMEKYNMDFDHLRPLLEETINKVRNHQPSEVQTGPAIRNDREVIGKHLELLQKDPELQAIYRTLTESIQRKHSS